MILCHFHLHMRTGIIFPAFDSATRGTVVTHLEVAERSKCIFINFSMFLDGDPSHGWPGRSPPPAETSSNRKISFHEELSHAVSISLITCSWFSLFLTCLPSLRDKIEGGLFEIVLDPRVDLVHPPGIPWLLLNFRVYGILFSLYLDLDGVVWTVFDHPPAVFK